MIDGEGCAGDYVLDVNIGGDAYDAPGLGADVNKFHDRVGPHNVLVERVGVREHFYGDALADDDDFFAVFAIEVVEIAPFDDGHAESGEKSGRDGAELRVRIFFAVGARVALRGELEAGAEDAFIAPGDGGADCDTIHSWKSGDLADGFFVEIEDLIGRASVGNDWDVDSEYIVGVETGVHGLQSEERFKEHAGAGEDAEAASGAAGDAHAAAREVHAVGTVGRRKSRDEREKHGSDYCEQRADPEHAGVNGEIERADGEAGSIAREDGDHGARDQDAERGTGHAEQ